MSKEKIPSFTKLKYNSFKIYLFRALKVLSEYVNSGNLTFHLLSSCGFFSNTNRFQLPTFKRCTFYYNVDKNLKDASISQLSMIAYLEFVLFWKKVTLDTVPSIANTPPPWRFLESQSRGGGLFRVMEKSRSQFIL